MKSLALSTFDPAAAASTPTYCAAKIVPQARTPLATTGTATHTAMKAARRFQPHAGYGAWIHELHHIHKKDAPSGTALMLQGAMRSAGYTRPIDVSATRAGHIPGTHTIGFDGPSETVTLTHTVRDRGVFAHGALEAARWLVGRRGWFTMRDFLTSTGV